MKRVHLVVIVSFVVIYALYVYNVNVTLESAPQIIVASTFFFALFAGFFMTRQNERYSRITNALAERDGAFSYLYRISTLVPRIQKNVLNIIRTHYQKILESNNWAYHEFNPSVTLKSLTTTFGGLTNDDIGGRTIILEAYKSSWTTILQLQQLRKRVIAAYQERLLPFQWTLIYILAAVLLFSYDLLASDSFVVNGMKVVFGTSVFFVIMLIRWLDGLSIFGKNFSRKIASDVLRVLDEVDEKELNKN